MKHSFSAIAIAAIALIGVGASAHADGTATDQSFGDWVLHCKELRKGETACALHQKIASKETRLPVAAFALSRHKDSHELRLSAIVPLGLDIPAGVSGKVGDVPLTFTVQTCIKRGCVASTTVDAKLLDSLRANQSFTATFKMRSVADPVSLPVSLKGLAEGLKALEAK